MLAAWRYRKRKSLIQSFDPRAWLIFFGCFIACTVMFWDFRFLLVFFAMSLIVVFTSGIGWKEMRRAWLFIGGFVLFFSVLTFLTGRGGMELYTTNTPWRPCKRVHHPGLAPTCSSLPSASCTQPVC